MLRGPLEEDAVLRGLGEEDPKATEQRPERRRFLAVGLPGASPSKRRVLCHEGPEQKMLCCEGRKKRTRRPRGNGASAGGFWRWAFQAPPRARGGLCATRALRRRCCVARAWRRGPEGHRATARAQEVFGRWAFQAL